MLTEKLMMLTEAGGSEWVMVLLLILSVISVSVMLERGYFYFVQKKRLSQLDDTIGPLIIKEDTRGLEQALKDQDCPVLAAAAETRSRGKDNESAEKVVSSVLTRERLRLEKRLTFLGTLGNNAPFIGLLGTVLGIIRAFRDLSMDAQGNSSAVMAGISEALVATAVGLFVALPAVLFFNYFQKQVDQLLSIKESLAQGILAMTPAGGHPYRGTTSGGKKRDDGDTNKKKSGKED